MTPSNDLNEIRELLSRELMNHAKLSEKAEQLAKKMAIDPEEHYFELDGHQEIPLLEILLKICKIADLKLKALTSSKGEVVVLAREDKRGRPKKENTTKVALDAWHAAHAPKTQDDEDDIEIRRQNPSPLKHTTWLYCDPCEAETEHKAEQTLDGAGYLACTQCGTQYRNVK